MRHGCSSSGVSAVRALACLGIGEASVPWCPEVAKSGTAEGKPQVEQYGLEELAASAEAVLAGLGPLAVSLARLAVAASRAVTLDAMEGGVLEEGRELLRGVIEVGVDVQAAGVVRR